MDSSSLTTAQASVIHHKARESLAYLQRLRRQMERLHFPHADPLYVATVDACNAMQHLLMTAHYLSCESGGRTCRA